MALWLDYGFTEFTWAHVEVCGGEVCVPAS